jgi:hypothetical protein
MAFNPNGLSALTYANGFTLWHYRTIDLASDVDTTGYFNPAANMLRVGDFLFVNADMDGTPTHGLNIVIANSAGVVDISNPQQLGLVNTD